MELINKNTAWKSMYFSLMSKLINLLGPLLLVPIFVKYLTVEEYGAWLMILSIATYFFLANPGITKVVSNAIARESDPNDINYYNQVASSGYYLFQKITIIVLFISLLFFILTKLFFGITFFKTESVVLFLPLLIMISLNLLTYPLTIYRSVLRGLDLIDIEQKYNIILGLLLRYLLTIIGLLSGLKLIYLAIIYSISNFLPSIGSKYFLKKLFPKFRVSKNDKNQELSQKMMQPVGSFFTLLISMAFHFSIGTVLIGFILGPSYVPMYAIPMQIIVLLVSSIRVASEIKMPLFSKLYKQNKLLDLQSLLRSLLFFSTVSMLIFTLNLYFFGEIIFISWAGDTIFPEREVFNLILVFGLIFCVFNPLSSILEATENISGYAKMSVIEALLNVLLAIYLTTYMGIKGTILSVIISRLLTNGWFLFGEILRVLEYKILDFIKWFVINLLLPLAILLCSVYLISHSSIVSYGSFITQIILLNLYLLCFFILTSKKNILKVFRLFF